MNGIMLQSFEWYMSSKGSLWRKIGENAPKLRALGITAVWLPPATKGMSGIHDVGYGVYDLYDLGEFDQKGTVRTKYGTKAEYIECIRRLHEFGIHALADVVLGQRLGADADEEVRLVPVWRNNRNMPAGDPFTATVITRFTFPGRSGIWSDFEWNASHICATDYYRDCDNADRVYLLPGKAFAKDTDNEFGNFDYLMGCDPDLNDPAVRAELKRWGTWMLYHTGVDGFRLDAVKHISADFYRDWLRDLRLFTGKELFAVGEYWHGDISVLMRYLESQNFGMSLFDVPLHNNFRTASVSGKDYDLRNLYTGTLAYARPTQSVTFVDNHDTQPGQSLESWVEPWFKPIAYALILLRAVGYPCVFYGDLYGLRHQKIPPVKGLEQLMRLRVSSALGIEHTYFDDPHCIGFTREGEQRRTGLAVMCSNNGLGEKRMYVGKKHASEKWICSFGNAIDIVIDDEGYGIFELEDDNLAVWTPKPSIPDRLLAFFERINRVE